MLTRPRSILLVALFAAACNPAKVVIGDGGVGDGGADGDGGATVSGDISVDPSSIDFGLVFVGQAVQETVTVTNIGDSDVDVTLVLGGPNASSFSVSPASTAPAPGSSSDHAVSFAPGTWGDLSAELTVTDAVSGGEVVVTLTGVVQIDADEDGFGSAETGGEDCDDYQSTTFPGAPDTWYDGVDSDCAGDDDYDQDADGYDINFDCDDTDPDAFPGASDDWYDGVDSDCAGDDDYDQDADGHQSDEYGGDDCDDTDAGIHPGVRDTWYDGVDSDCAGNDDYDQDADGHQSEDYGGDDCDDTDDAVHPGAADAWYDGVDSDCAGNDDYDQDEDGLAYDEDCDDTDAAIGAAEDETLNGEDDDCNGTIDDLSVEDAASGVLLGYSSSMGLGDVGSLGMVGDVTGDGAVDLVIATDNTSYGYAWVVDGDDATGAKGSVASYDTARVGGESSYYVVGSVISPAGDQDGDGTAELVVGATSTSSYYLEGRVYLFDGGSGVSGTLTASSDYDARFSGDSTNDQLRVGSLGDIDGDGYDDMVTGARYDNYVSGTTSAVYAGNVAVFAGGSLSGSYDLGDSDYQIAGQSAYDYLGSSLMLADLDDDGYVDIVTGAPGDDDGGSNAGAVYVMPGNASLSWSARADSASDIKIQGPSTNDALGEDPIPMAGDVDGDGAYDMLIPSENEGQAWLFLEASTASSGASASRADHIFSGTAGDFATAAAIDSDLDGDGNDEIVLGADSADVSSSNSGAIYIFRYSSSWSTSLTSSSAVATLWGQDSGDYVGTGLAGGQDLDGDGAEDLLVGAVGVDDGATDGGAVYVILGW